MVKEAEKEVVAPAQSVGFDSLKSVAMEARMYEEEIRSHETPQKSYITILSKVTDPVRNKANPAYIADANLEDFIIKKHGITLGKAFRATVLACCPVYKDTVAGENPKDMRRTVGFWRPQDAEQLPRLDDGFTRFYLDRKGVEHQLSNTVWVFLYLHDHPEIEDAVLSCDGTANKIARELSKNLVSTTRIFTEKQFLVTTQQIEAKGYGTSHLYPLFTESKMNFKTDEDYNVIENKDDGESFEIVSELLKRSAAIMSDYTSSRMVQAKLDRVAGVETYKIESKQHQYEAAGEAEEEDIKF